MLADLSSSAVVDATLFSADLIILVQPLEVFSDLSLAIVPAHVLERRSTNSEQARFEAVWETI